MLNSIAHYMKEQSRIILAFEFSSVQANFPDEIAQEIIAWGKSNIPEEDLINSGRETDIHVTVKYGLHTHNWDDVRSVLMQEIPFEITLGLISLFENEDQDVVKLSIGSDDLARLNKLIASSFKCTDTFPTYIPHCTIAYVKSGLGKKYDGRKDFEGKRVKLDSVLFSGNDGRRTLIPFKIR